MEKPVETTRIRPFRRTDAAAIAQIYNESIAAGDATMDEVPRSEADVLAWMDAFTDRETILVLEDDAAVRGWGIVKRYSDRPGYRYACETSVYLTRSLAGRRTGSGSRLQQALMEQCRYFGYHHVVARIWAVNEISLALHRKFGFEPVGVQRQIGYVNGAWQDVVILQCLLETPETPGWTSV